MSIFSNNKFPLLTYHNERGCYGLREHSAPLGGVFAELEAAETPALE